MANEEASISSVKVALRVRPLNSREQNESEQCITLQPGSKVVEVKDQTNPFSFDFVYGNHATQAQIYKDTTAPLIDRVMDGFNATIIAYGQTGSGKTHTMGTAFNGSSIDDTTGIIPRAVADIFERRDAIKQKKKCEVRISFLQIYNEEAMDLLTKDSPVLKVKENSNGETRVVGLSSQPVESVEDVSKWITMGTSKRATAATNMNSVSSRSHAICTLTLEMGYEKPELGSTLSDGTPVEIDEDDLNAIEKVGTLTLVDLAGSERLKKTGATGAQQTQGIKINQGLLALGNVINALAALADRVKSGGMVGGHVPYRGSKLTRVLQNALGGNSQTLMVACVSPAASSTSETASTVNYAARARSICNATLRNESTSTSNAIAECKQLRKEISRLKLELSMSKQTQGGSSLDSLSSSSSSSISNHELLSEINSLKLRLGEVEQQLTSETEACMTHAMRADQLALCHEQLVALAREKGLDISNSSSGSVFNPLTLRQESDEADSLGVVQQQRREIESLRQELENLKRKQTCDLNSSSSYFDGSEQDGNDVISFGSEELNEMMMQSDMIEKLKGEVAALQAKQSSTSSNSGTSKLSQEDKAREKELEKKAKELERMQRDYSKLKQRKEEAERHVNNLKNDLTQSKKMQVQLQRVAEKEAKLHSKQMQDEARKTASALRDASKKEALIAKSENENARAIANLKRTQEALALSRKQVQEAKKAIKEKEKPKTIVGSKHGIGAAGNNEETISRWVQRAFEVQLAAARCTKVLHYTEQEKMDLEKRLAGLRSKLNTEVLEDSEREQAKLQVKELKASISSKLEDIDELRAGSSAIKTNAVLAMRTLSDSIKCVADGKTATSHMVKFSVEATMGIIEESNAKVQRAEDEEHDAIAKLLEEHAERDNEKLEVISNQAEMIKNLFEKEKNMRGELNRLGANAIEMKLENCRLREALMNRGTIEQASDHPEEKDDICCSPKLQPILEAKELDNIEEEEEEEGENVTESAMLDEEERAVAAATAFNDGEWVDSDSDDSIEEYFSEEEEEIEEYMDDDDSDYEEERANRIRNKKEKQSGKSARSKSASSKSAMNNSAEVSITSFDSSLNEISLNSSNNFVDLDVSIDDGATTDKKSSKVAKKSRGGGGARKRVCASDLPPPPPLEGPLENMTVPSLKDALRARGLTVSGKKVDLISRLEEYLSLHPSDNTSDTSVIDMTSPSNTTTSPGLLSHLNDSMNSVEGEAEFALDFPPVTNITKRKSKNISSDTSTTAATVVKKESYAKSSENESSMQSKKSRVDKSEDNSDIPSFRNSVYQDKTLKKPTSALKAPSLVSVRKPLSSMSVNIVKTTTASSDNGTVEKKPTKAFVAAIPPSSNNIGRWR